MTLVSKIIISSQAILKLQKYKGEIMKVIQPSYRVITPLDGEGFLKTIEEVARTCYKSEDKIGEGTAVKMIRTLVDKKHEAMIEFADIIVRFVTNRGFSHELVRHRLASFAQERTRYCNYSQDKVGNEITVIEPYWKGTRGVLADHAWAESMESAEKKYFELLSLGAIAQEARGVLPNDLKTEINIKANIREWRNIFKLRTAAPAHPDMHRLMIPLLKEFQENIPVLFDDITYGEG